VLHLLSAALLLVLAAFLFYDTLRLPTAAASDKRLEVFGRIVGIVLTGIGGLYVLFVRKRDQDDLAVLQGSITRLTNSLANAEQGANSVAVEYAKRYFEEMFEPRLKDIETKAASATKYIELQYTDEQRKRERRDEALMKLSTAVFRTTRAFKALTKFRLGEGVPTEALVNTLAQALAAREQFLVAREELSVLHAIDPKHAQNLVYYGTLLIDIIIDVRRNKPDDKTTGHDAIYHSTMSAYEQKLDEYDRDIGAVLHVFLAPQHRLPISPTPPGSAQRDRPSG
jgi:hypothetical protein